MPHRSDELTSTVNLSVDEQITESKDETFDSHRAIDIDDLNYTSRQIELATPDDTFIDLKNKTLLYLQTTIKQFYPHFDPHKNDAKVDGLTSSQQSILYLYNTFNTLTILNVPPLNHANAVRQYCPLDVLTEGVTEKISLVSLETVMNTMQRVLSFSNKTDEIIYANNFGLAPDAIIKLPKHNEITEVQHEAIALNIARLLGFNTTASTMLLYNGLPALFIPFDKIEKLSEFAEGKKETAFETRKSYIDYSTIQPVGEGLMPDQCIEDFGNIFAYLYLCSDPDAIGGYNQNKALTDSKNLYVFDQAVKIDTLLSIDSCVNLYIGTFSSLSRHLKGRNKSLIEDSLIEEKIHSMIALTKNKLLIDSLMDCVHQTHTSAIALAERLNPALQKKNLVDLATFHKDALSLHAKIDKRISEIFSKFPKVDNEAITTETAERATQVIPALVLEKVINNPRFFTDDGRPYKHPWTENHNIKIMNISMGTSAIEITLNKSIDATLASTLFAKAGIQWKKTPNKNNSIIMPLVEYQKIHESVFFPENATQFSVEAKYIPTAGELELIKQTYKTNDAVIQTSSKCIETYLKTITNSAINYVDKINAMRRAINTIKQLPVSKDVGFIQHMLRKLHFDIQKQLYNMIENAETKALMIHAFNAAIKLDRISIFNDVIMTAISTNHSFTGYLRQCIRHANMSTNYHLSKEHSTLFLAESESSQHVFLNHLSLTQDSPSQSEQKSMSPSKSVGPAQMSMNEERDRVSLSVLIKGSHSPPSPTSASTRNQPCVKESTSAQIIETPSQWEFH